MWKSCCQHFGEKNAKSLHVLQIKFEEENTVWMFSLNYCLKNNTLQRRLIWSACCLILLVDPHSLWPQARFGKYQLSLQCLIFLSLRLLLISQGITRQKASRSSESEATVLQSPQTKTQPQSLSKAANLKHNYYPPCHSPLSEPKLFGFSYLECSWENRKWFSCKETIVM